MTRCPVTYNRHTCVPFCLGIEGARCKLEAWHPGEHVAKIVKEFGATPAEDTHQDFGFKVQECLAVLARNTHGFVDMLQWSGAALQREIEDGTAHPDDHGWDPPPPGRPGLWLWIGVVVWTGGHAPEDPAEPEFCGTFRALTREEAHRVACGESIVGPEWPPIGEKDP